MTRFAFALFVVAIVAAPNALGQDAASAFKAKVKPLIEAHCVECHGRDQAEARINFEELAAGDLGRGFKDWEKAINALRTGKMPPADATRPVYLNLGQGVANDTYVGRGVCSGHSRNTAKMT